MTSKIDEIMENLNERLEKLGKIKIPGEQDKFIKAEVHQEMEPQKKSQNEKKTR